MRHCVNLTFPGLIEITRKLKNKISWKIRKNDRMKWLCCTEWYTDNFSYLFLCFVKLASPRQLMQQSSCNLHECYIHEKKCNNIFKKVKMPREAEFDSCCGTALTGHKKAQAHNTVLVVFRPCKFCEKLVTFLRGGTLPESGDASTLSRVGWNRLGQAVQPFLNRSPLFTSCMVPLLPKKLNKKVFNLQKHTNWSILCRVEYYFLSIHQTYRPCTTPFCWIVPKVLW